MFFCGLMDSANVLTFVVTLQMMFVGVIPMGISPHCSRRGAGASEAGDAQPDSHGANGHD